MCECYNKSINRAVAIIIIIMILVFLFYFTLMNVDGVLGFSQLLFSRRKTSVLLFVDNSRFINDSRYEFVKMFVATIPVTSMACKSSLLSD